MQGLQRGPTPWWDRSLRGVAVVLLCTWATVVPIVAQNLHDPRYRWQERSQPARWEGLKPMEIAGERIDLLAVLLMAATPEAPQAGGTSYTLGFYLPQAEPQVRIAVRDYQRFPRKYHYWMLPKQQQYDRGFQKFAWEATLLRELNISLQDIGAVARIASSEHSAPVVAPLLLSSTPLATPIRLQGCRFEFLPSATMRVEYVLYPKGDEGRAFVKGPTREWDKDHRQTIAWSGQDSQGKPVAAGWYGLRLTATMGRSGTAGEPPLILDWLFYYTPEIRG